MPNGLTVMQAPCGLGLTQAVLNQWLNLQSAGRFFPRSDDGDHLKRCLPSSGGMLCLLGFVVNKCLATGGIQEIHIACIFLLTFVGLCIGDLSSFLVFFICCILLESSLWLAVFACSIATLQFF